MEEVYDPDAYFTRLGAGLGDPSTPFAPARARYWRRHPIARVRGQAWNLARAAALYARLMLRVDDAGLRRRYRREIARQLRSHRDPGRLFGIWSAAHCITTTTRSRGRWGSIKGRSSTPSESRQL